MTGTKPQLPELPHRLLLDERQHLELTGIREVLRFDEARVALRSTRGVVLISGSGLKLRTLTPEDGRVVVDGSIDAVGYAEDRRRGSLRKKLFG